MNNVSVYAETAESYFDPDQSIEYLLEELTRLIDDPDLENREVYMGMVVAALHLQIEKLAGLLGRLKEEAVRL